MRVAAVQLPESWAVADGIGACRELAAKASAEGAALAVFPELSLTGSVRGSGGATQRDRDNTVTCNPGLHSTVPLPRILTSSNTE